MVPKTSSRRVPEQPTALTISECAILGLLAFGEKSGYELARFADRSIGFIWAPARSQIYKVLPRLAATGLVRARIVEQTKRPDKQLYRLTPLGRRVLRSWLATVEAGGAPDVYLLKVFFGRHAPPGAPAAQVGAYRDVNLQVLRRFEELDARLPRDGRNELPLRVLGLGIARGRAAVAWADDMLRDLERAVGT